MPSRTRHSTGSRGRRRNLAANPASLLLMLLRCSHQAKERGSRFCSRSLRLYWHLEQDQLGDIGPRSMPPAWRVRRRLPVQEPLIRAKIKERELRGPEDGLSHTRFANLDHTLVVVIPLDAVG